MSLSRPLKVILYAAFVGLLLASYVSPLQQILEGKNRIAQLSSGLETVERNNAAKERMVEELQTPAGVERAARERYGMIKPGEKAYI
ncbi:MAG: septum formation initiator family protein, partial [Actinomycetota bacterium]|nr:septum formation initiator family protein [Actinomycetota bacterium]